MRRARWRRSPPTKGFGASGFRDPGSRALRLRDFGAWCLGSSGFKDFGLWLLCFRALGFLGTEGSKGFAAFEVCKA